MIGTGTTYYRRWVARISWLISWAQAEKAIEKKHTLEATVMDVGHIAEKVAGLPMQDL